MQHPKQKFIPIKSRGSEHVLEKCGKQDNANELPRGRAVEVSNGVCDANGLVSDLEGRGIKP